MLVFLLATLTLTLTATAREKNLEHASCPHSCNTRRRRLGRESELHPISRITTLCCPLDRRVHWSGWQQALLPEQVQQQRKVVAVVVAVVVGKGKAVEVLQGCTVT